MTVAKESQDEAKVDNNACSKDIIFPQEELWSDEPPLESDKHQEQMELLLSCIRWYWREQTNFYASGNLTIYFSEEEKTTEDFRGPDFFVVKGCKNYQRTSWMLWRENYKYPNVIIELLSKKTAKVDRGLKKQIYQDTFQTPEYFWFHPVTLEFKGFRLFDGKYQPLQANEEGWLWSEELELFLGIYKSHLRFFGVDKQLIPTPEEAERIEKEAAQQRAEVERLQKEAAQQQAEDAQQRAEMERLQKEAAQRQVEELKARLKALGIDPDAIE
jgi:Uma2 family endonuclease